MKIVCATSVLFGQEAFSTLGSVAMVPDGDIDARVLRDTEALAIRSKTPVTRALLEDTAVTFVGTATAGFDHMDTAWLEQAGIRWCASPGCNANSVAEYVITALLTLAHRHAFKLEGMTIGVIGVGQVGSRVASKAEKLGMRVLLNDPPLYDKTHDPHYLSLDAVLAEADILTFHTPLTDTHPYPTRGMVSGHFFSRVKPGVIFINASRGEVVDTRCLQSAIEESLVAHAILDVWENEPSISTELLQRVDLGTPHIAGYSFEGRLNGTVQVYQAMRRFFERPPEWIPDATRFPQGHQLDIDARAMADERVLWQICATCYDIEADDRALRTGSDGTDKVAAGRHFHALRKQYPERREFAGSRVRLQHASPKLIEKIEGLGFTIAPF